ncbi:AtpZ/AtpI family protein [Modestobacter sp. SYSU DS0657]
MAEDLPARGEARPRPAHPARQPSGADMGWAVTGTMISGMAVWGGVGWLLDRWLGTVFLLPVGVVLGVTVAIYVVVKKYGALDPVPGQHTGTNPGGRRSRPRTQKGQR